MKQCVDEARGCGRRPVWLVTKNNLGALAFYQRLGMDLCAFHRYGVRASRCSDSRFPCLRDGECLEHEPEFELLLDA